MFKAKRRTVVTGTAVVAVLLGGALAATLLTQGKSQATNTVEYQAGQRPLVPDISGTSLTGTKIDLASYRGKTVVLNFWGSWCSPCRDEAGTLNLLNQQYGKQGVVFLGDDVADSPASALAFTRSVGTTYPSISDPGYAVTAQIGQVVPVHDTPTTVVIDRTGRVAGMILGPVSYDGMAALLKDAAVTQ